MDEKLNPPDTEATWQSLARLVQNQATAIRDLTVGTPYATATADLARNANLLAEQIYHLADAAPAWFAQLNQPAESPASPEALDEINREMIEIQRETHHGPNEIMDIVKALFMWRDTPVERIRGRQSEKNDAPL